MGAKDIKEVVDLLKAICVYEKTTLQEVQIMRKEINANMKTQHEILKQWMKKDLDHHFKDNAVALAFADKLNGSAASPTIVEKTKTDTQKSVV